MARQRKSSVIVGRRASALGSRQRHAPTIAFHRVNKADRARLIAGLHDAHIEVVTPVEREHRSGIVTFSVGSAADNIALMDKLLDRDILVSVRYTANIGGVRISSHFYNSDADIDRLLEAVSAVAR